VDRTLGLREHDLRNVIVFVICFETFILVLWFKFIIDIGTQIFKFFTDSERYLLRTEIFQLFHVVVEVNTINCLLLLNYVTISGFDWLLGDGNFRKL
jgi:hypothetical protein